SDGVSRRRRTVDERGVRVADPGGVGRLDGGDAGERRIVRPPVHHRSIQNRTERAHLRPHEVAPGGEKRLRWVVADRTREGEGQTARIPCAEGPTSQDEASGRLSCVAEVT